MNIVAIFSRLRGPLANVKKAATMSVGGGKRSGDGEYRRAESSFRRFVTADGREGTLRAESGRFHLYVSLACPWAHRTLITRKLKGLEEAVTVDVVHWKEWSFLPGADGDDSCTADTVGGRSRLREVYLADDPDYTGRFTVPMLYDKREMRVVNNESSEIIRMLNSEFNTFCRTPKQAALDLYPQELRTDVDEVNEWIYNDINNGVYKVGFASTQEAYEGNVRHLFKALDRVEEMLSQKRYLTGSQLTEADVRLFTTLVRFDPVYVGHFKCNLRQVASYPNMFNYLKELYQMPAFVSTTDFGHIKRHYYVAHSGINPKMIVPLGPEQDLDSPHDRADKKSDFCSDSDVG